MNNWALVMTHPALWLPAFAISYYNLLHSTKILLVHTLNFFNCSSSDAVSEIRNSEPSWDSMFLIFKSTASMVLRNCFGGPDSSAAVNCFILSSRVDWALDQRSSIRLTPAWRCGVWRSSLLRLRDSSRTLIRDTSLVSSSSSLSCNEGNEEISHPLGSWEERMGEGVRIKWGVGEEGRRRERVGRRRKRGGGKIFVRRIIRSKTITTLALRSKVLLQSRVTNDYKNS